MQRYRRARTAPAGPSGSDFQKFFRFNCRLFQDRSQRTLWHFAGMVGNGGVTIGRGIEPDFVAPGGLTVELEATRSQFPCDFTITESREPAHSSGHHNGKFMPGGDDTGQRCITIAFAASFDQLPCDIASDVERFCDGPALRDKSRNLFGSGQKCPFGQLLNLNANCEFHTVRSYHSTTGRTSPASAQPATMATLRPHFHPSLLSHPATRSAPR